jgi:hypothetical protein
MADVTRLTAATIRTLNARSVQWSTATLFSFVTPVVLSSGDIITPG